MPLNFPLVIFFVYSFLCYNPNSCKKTDVTTAQRRIYMLNRHEELFYLGKYVFIIGFKWPSRYLEGLYLKKKYVVLVSLV